MEVMRCRRRPAPEQCPDDDVTTSRTTIDTYVLGVTSQHDGRVLRPFVVSEHRATYLALEQSGAAHNTAGRLAVWLANLNLLLSQFYETYNKMLKFISIAHTNCITYII